MGFVLTVFIGPSFFYLIKVSLDKGFIPAVFFALGIILSDFAMIFLIFLGFSELLESRLFQEIFSFSSGIVLIALGVISLFKQRLSSNVSPIFDSNHMLFWYTLKGIVINGLNPFTFMIWIGIVGGVGVHQNYGTKELKVFFMGLLSVILCADILKAYLANRIKGLLNEKLIRRIQRVLAVIFIILGLRLILLFIKLFFQIDIAI